MIGPGMLAPSGRAGAQLSTLGWTLNIVSLVVVLVVTVLVALALYRRRGGEGETADGHAIRTTLGGVLVGEEGDANEARALRWIRGVAVATIVILFGAFAYSMWALTAYSAVLHDSTPTLRVVGYRYWWKLEYLRPNGAVDFVAANEVHIPVGQPVQILLDGGDVIHSFWVPALGGKTDLVPGQRNRMWLEADTAGVYHGFCAEFCGTEHAKMEILVVAEPAAEFARWEAAQRGAAQDASPEALAVFHKHGCASCHAVAGTDARGDAGPDLTHVGSRSTLAAGIAPNTPATLARWLSAPDAMKPGSMMPRTGLDSTDLSTLVSYLGRLR